MILPSLTGSHILITGAGGYIGSALCHTLLLSKPASLTMLNATESGLYQLHRQFSDNPCRQDTTLKYVLGSVTDACLMAKVTRGVHVVIHAAAHKHVPMCEANPTQAICNNVGGTYVLVHQAWRNLVERVVLISSDKAVCPTSVMGATKRVAEMVTTSYDYDVARLCNIYGSTGSVVPLWQEQIAQGGPITLTDPGCERYFNSILDVCELITAMLMLPRSGSTYMIDPGTPQNLMELAKQLMLDANTPCEIQITGLRPGEKRTEDLYIGHRYPLNYEGIPSRVFRVETSENPLEFLRDLHDLVTAAGTHQCAEAVALLWKLVQS